MELFKNETVSFLSNPITCDICPKTFAAKSTLKLHNEINHQHISSNFNKTKVTENRNTDINFEIDIEECIEFEENFHNLKPKIKIENDFCEVTLACDDNEVEAHVILVHPNLVIEFMHEYTTEINVQVRDESEISLYHVALKIGLLNLKNCHFCNQVRGETVMIFSIIKTNYFQIQMKFYKRINSKYLVQNQNKMFQVF